MELLLAVCMLIQEVADMLFHLEEPISPYRLRDQLGQPDQPSPHTERVSAVTNDLLDEIVHKVIGDI